MSSRPPTSAQSGGEHDAAAADRLARELALGGHLTEDWAPAWARVDREVFVPDRVWVPEPGGYRRLDRSDEPGRWRALVYSDTHLVTQVAEGPDAAFAFHPTSSASMPRMVAGMLALLDVRDGQRVLEIGTGAGITAALLSERLGHSAVTSIEIDRSVSAQARAALKRAGYAPRLVVGDGTAGVADGAPFDRVLSTCAVRSIPPAWVAQTRPGGRIVTPFGTTLYNGVLLCLDVHDSAGDTDGVRPGAGRVAVGRVVGDAAFMWERGQGLDPGVMTAIRHEDQAVERTVAWDPRLLVGSADAAFAAGLLVPGIRRSVGRPAGPSNVDEFTLWLVDPGSGSWACVDHSPGRAAFDAAVYGPRDLLTETGQALTWWNEAGQPHRTRFGVTVPVDAAQTIWLDTPANTVAHQPAA